MVLAGPLRRSLFCLFFRFLDFGFLGEETLFSLHSGVLELRGDVLVLVGALAGCSGGHKTLFLEIYLFDVFLDSSLVSAPRILPGDVFTLLGLGPDISVLDLSSGIGVFGQFLFLTFFEFFGHLTNPAALCDGA